MAVNMRLSTLFVIMFGSSAWGFENICTHPEMVQNSAILLSSVTKGNYLEASSFDTVHQMRLGTRDEDGGPSSLSILRAVMNHFYEAPTGRALSVPGVLPYVMLSGNEDAVTLGTRYHAEAVGLYRSNQKSLAYNKLGHALHLLADLYQPAHTHNDAHIPTVTYDKSLLEAYVEGQCHSVANYIPAGDAVFHEPTNDVSELMARGALETYNRAIFFSNGDGVSPRGLLRDNELLLTQVDGVEGSPNKCLAARHWILRDPITENELCYDDALKQEGTLSDSFYNDWWEVYGSPIARRLNAASVFTFYVDRYEKVENGHEQTLTQDFAATQLKPAVERGAGMIELFAKRVDSASPIISDLVTGSGRPFFENDVIDDDVIDVSVEDPASPDDSPFPSGIYQLYLTRESAPEMRIQPDIGIVQRQLKRDTLLLKVTDI
ncbi:MAG: hypothetical protein M0D55_09855 [Elusimicrobiota bacterium]|nr:MAG: hypothetical protein M0D55_09855 [Elusimicrobiota bacterium]